MRGRMNDVKSYVEPMQLGDVMTGESAGVVVESSSERYSPGDHVAVHQVISSTILAPIPIAALTKGLFWATFWRSSP